jgi:hypothetical protein
MYADFLDEASLVLNKPSLREVARLFRTSAQAWRELAEALLPENIPMFKETRNLMLRKHRLFLDQGNAAQSAIQQINTRLVEIKDEVTLDFPLNESQVAAMRENLRAHVLKIHDVEQEAIRMLQAAMA